jgi:deltex-like protein
LERSAFLPHNEDGCLIAKLMNIAFTRRLTFTVDKSQTTGEEGALVWNDIHHKTKRDGGPEQ